ncbi:MAG: alpha/beta hydrolase [Solirubrobacteraceae bacterium]
MTTTTMTERAPRRARTTTRVGRRAPETAVFAVAVAVWLVHVLDDALMHREPGVGPRQHLLAVVVSLALGLGAVYGFPSLRAAARSAVAVFFAALATVDGAIHAKHIAAESAGASDVTGVLALAAGVVLIGLAAAVLWLHRGEGEAGARRRWAYRIAAVPVGLLLALYTVVPIGTAITETHKYREHVGAPPSADYREVAFDASDGVHLSGWYRPTRNGATLLVLHGGGGDRTGAVAHAKLLARHGYGVLLYDARGRGKSEGQQNAFGWGWTKDIAGAIAFLKSRPEVDAQRIGGLGLSTGADALVQAAGQGADLHAVVADGTAAESFEDWRRLQGVTAMTPMFAAEFATVRITSGAHAGPPLEDMIKHVTRPLLLVSAGRHEERDFNLKYDRDAGSRPVEHWNVPEAGHTGAIRDAAPEYERRVTAFFDRALSRRLG